ncbi:hypothetical protein PoB_006384100 [Plakobranchus ocellatus]|uniref:PiggyBac transposable element-derived protein domain-containing protein n=1 Tax=Plakobranchus ocellatus TaxID=259542 RepID=A0AAV4D023_9GAST|nr:hypothetical protein PoB_006384100 [Plakobranchus ocellatus]
MSDLESDFEEDFRANDTSDSLVTSSDESDLDEDLDSVIDDDNSDPDQGPWLPIIGEDQEPSNIPFTSHPGPKIRLDRAAKRVDYFRLFISAQIIDLFVKETNRYGTQNNG